MSLMKTTSAGVIIHLTSDEAQALGSSERYPSKLRPSSSLGFSVVANKEQALTFTPSILQLLPSW